MTSSLLCVTALITSMEGCRWSLLKKKTSFPFTPAPRPHRSAPLYLSEVFTDCVHILPSRSLSAQLPATSRLSNQWSKMSLHLTWKSQQHSGPIYTPHPGALPSWDPAGSGGSLCSLARGHITPIFKASVSRLCSLCTTSCVCQTTSGSSLKERVMASRHSGWPPHVHTFNLVTLAKTPFAQKVAFTGYRE